MTRTLTVRLRGVGLLGPGLTDWASGASLLREPANWQPSATILGAPSRLPAAERRRAGAIVKLSIAVAEQACADAGINTHSLATVFSASTGDAHNCHALCEALASADPQLSPTRFTNSVHNAAAGYWHIAAGSRAPSTSLCGFDASFGAGLLEAVSQCVAGQRAVLLVVADVPYPEPLHSQRPLPDAFGVALLISPDIAGSEVPGRPPATNLSLRLVARSPVATKPQPELSGCDDPRLEALRQTLPAGRALPLLQALAAGRAAQLVIDYLDTLGLAVELSPAIA